MNSKFKISYFLKPAIEKNVILNATQKLHIEKNVIFYLFICPIKFKVYIKLKTVFFKIKKLYFLDLYKVYT